MILRAASLLLVACLLLSSVRADTVELNPIRDNTLIDYVGPSGETSGGASEWLFSGRTGPGSGAVLRRMILDFDLAAAIPAGSTIDAVELSLVQLDVGGAGLTHVVDVHRCLADWGEGASSSRGGLGVPALPQDATWTLRFFPATNTAWSTAGGDYDPTVLSSIPVSGTPSGLYTWTSTPAFVNVAQGWLDEPDDNHGIIVRHDDEAFVQSAKRWASREDPLGPPVLSVTFTPPVQPDPHFVRGDCNADGDVDIADAVFGLGVLSAMGGPAPCDDACDTDDDGGLDLADMVSLLNNLFSGGPDPLPPSPDCGQDSTADGMDCETYSACP